MILEKRRKVALKKQSSVISKRFNYVLLGMLIGVLIAIIMFFINSGVEEVQAIKKLQQSVKKSKGVAIKNVQYKSIDSGMDVNAKTAVQANGDYVLESVKVKIGKNSELRANKAKVQDQSKRMTVTGKVIYKQKKGVKITTDSLEIDTKKNIIFGHDGVVAKDGNVKITGEKFKYEQKNKVLKVKNKVIIEIEE